MATVEYIDNFHDAISDTDILVMQVNKNGSLSVSDLPFYDVTLLEFSKNIDTHVVGFSYPCIDDRKILVWYCKRKVKRNKKSIDPFMGIIKNIAELLLLDKRNTPFRKSFAKEFPDHPGDMSGRITICGELSDEDIKEISDGFKEWDGTIILVNTKSKEIV